MDEVRIEEYFVEGEVDIEAFIGLISSEDSKIITEFKFNEEFFFNGFIAWHTGPKNASNFIHLNATIFCVKFLS